MLTKMRAFGLAVLLILTAAVPCTAAELRVLAAFTLKPALDAVAQQYRQSGSQVTLVYGPTPALAQQIEKGAPADLFFSADPMWMDELAKKNLLRPDSVTELLGNRLVLIARKASAANPVIGDTQLAMCDPDSHPVGRYAKASLTSLGLWAKTEKEIVRAENPLLAVKMVARGDIPAAIVFATDAQTDDGVRIVETLPDTSHPKILYPVAIVAGSKNPDAARFLAFLKSSETTAQFRGFGYLPSVGGN